MEVSRQNLKEAGLDDFKMKSQAALDGVLFMDEAYTLYPVEDKFKGAPIANELLTLAENERDDCLSSLQATKMKSMTRCLHSTLASRAASLKSTLRTLTRMNYCLSGMVNVKKDVGENKIIVWVGLWYGAFQR